MSKNLSILESLQYKNSSRSSKDKKFFTCSCYRNGEVLEKFGLGSSIPIDYIIVQKEIQKFLVRQKLTETKPIKKNICECTYTKI